MAGPANASWPTCLDPARLDGLFRIGVDEVQAIVRADPFHFMQRVGKALGEVCRALWHSCAAPDDPIQHGISNARVDRLNTKVPVSTRRAYGFHFADAACLGDARGRPRRSQAPLRAGNGERTRVIHTCGQGQNAKRHHNFSTRAHSECGMWTCGFTEKGARLRATTIPWRPRIARTTANGGSTYGQRMS